MQSLFLFIWAQRKKKKKRSKILFLQFRNYCELMGWDGKSWVWWEKTSLFSHMNQLPFQPFSYGCQLCQMKSYSECHSSWGWSFEIDSIYRIKQIFSNGCVTSDFFKNFTFIRGFHATIIEKSMKFDFLNRISLKISTCHGFVVMLSQNKFYFDRTCFSFFQVVGCTYLK